MCAARDPRLKAKKRMPSMNTACERENEAAVGRASASSRTAKSSLTRWTSALALAAVVGATTGPGPVSADPPPAFATHVHELADHVVRDGRTAEGILPLLELWRAYGDVEPALMQRELDRIVADRRVLPAIRGYAAQLRARATLRAGDRMASNRAFEALGYVRSFRVAGPFDNEGKGGFTQVFEPERDRMGPVVLGARFEGRERSVGWRTFPDVGHYGYVSFDAVYRPDTNVCAYAETTISSERAQPLTLFVGGGGAIAMWWNGEEVVRDGTYRQPDPDRHGVVVGASAGVNRVLVKACVTDTTWGFYLRVAGGDGQPLTRGPAQLGLSIDPDADVSHVTAGNGSVRLPRAPVMPLRELEARATGERATARALETLARYLTGTGSDDPDVQRARQLSARAAELEPTPARLVFAAASSTARGDATRLLDRAAALAPQDPDVLLAVARLRMTGVGPEEALRVIARIPAGTTAAIEGLVLRAEIESSLGLEETSRATVERLALLAPSSPRIAALRARAAEAVEARDTAMTLFRESLALRFDDQASREVLINDAIARGDEPGALALVDDYAVLSNDSAARLVRVAAFYDAISHDDRAMASYRAAIELAPEDAEASVAMGRALLRGGQNDIAQTTLREALALRPQDAETRELLELMEPVERRDESYAVSSETFLARRTEAQAFPVHVLEDLTVNTVFESGLGSSFRQYAAQIVNDEGARLLRTYPITFDPDVQRVTIRAARVYRNGRELQASESFEQQLGEPWYRIYYDTRAMIVVFPDLEPGDVVEMRYRVDDVAERNRFRDYYGDLHYFQGAHPSAQNDYVLVTPSARTFYTNTPTFPSGQVVAREEHVDGDTRILHFRAVDVPAIDQEEGMPGMTEVAPYLHVSTYQSWNDVGRWWWGLVHDQLQADESLRRTVQDLVRGAPDNRTKVERIYRWVIDHTRYVGLEFGIHGFLPYRVSQIVQRGFGDCKDKASLLYVMLTEAGVDARMVLVRTRRNGDIAELPASLAVFDHAIAYVPELDLFLDGTAEFHGITEFPAMDQGVSVLVVGPNDVNYRRSPVLDPSHNHRHRELVATLDENGTARITGSDTVTGIEAPGYRSTYQAAATRRERFGRQMRSIFPGIEVANVRFENLDQYERPAIAIYEASVPRFATRDADGLRVGVSVLDDLVRLLARTEHRRYPLELGAPLHYDEERRIRPPAGYEVATLPTGGTIDSSFGRFVVATRRDGRDVVVTSELIVNRDRVSPDEYPAFRQFISQADAILRARIALSRGGAR